METKKNRLQRQPRQPKKKVLPKRSGLLLLTVPESRNSTHEHKITATRSFRYTCSRSVPPSSSLTDRDATMRMKQEAGAEGGQPQPQYPLVAYPDPRGPQEVQKDSTNLLKLKQAKLMLYQAATGAGADHRGGQTLGIKQTEEEVVVVGAINSSRDNRGVIIVKSLGTLPETAQTGLQEVTGH
ncbi:hypothetical protein AAFF_G00420120 [Aldrovandia affinis]|uniref:Uncharacterized protein n=1 Tax=Aldrovandia affinis TaxID=143900 RepID=A0AAD7SA82_9TELE|nr:hypothetical protein AAFF_G00420120 [Aldrovandia affinis]